MAIALDPTRTVRYVLRSDLHTPSADQTIFLLQPLTVQQEADLKNRVTVRNADGTTTFKAGDLELESLRMGLAGCENLKGRDGNAVPFVMYDRRVSDAFLNVLPKEWRAELASAIYDLNEISDTEKKA